MHPKCEEKACPFQAMDGTKLCRQHARFFTWDVSMEDRSIQALRFDANAEYKNVNSDGLVFHKGQRAETPSEKWLTKESNRQRVLHQTMASGFILKKIIPELESIGDAGRAGLFGNHFAAEELIADKRYGSKPCCTLCGCEERYMTDRYIALAGRRIFICALCKYQYTATTQSVFHDSRFSLGGWLNAIHLMNIDRSHGITSVIQREINSNYRTAWKMHQKIQISGQSAGLELGNKNTINRRKEGYTTIGRLFVPNSWAPDFQ